MQFIRYDFISFAKASADTLTQQLANRSRRAVQQCIQITSSVNNLCSSVCYFGRNICQLSFNATAFKRLTSPKQRL